MSNTLTIDKSRVIKAAKSCPTADNILRILFPEAFNSGLIGTYYTPIDNSYSRNIVTREKNKYPEECLAGGSGTTGAKSCLVVSEPYKDSQDWDKYPDKLHTFINVEYKGNVYRVLYYKQALMSNE